MEASLLLMIERVKSSDQGLPYYPEPPSLGCIKTGQIGTVPPFSSKYRHYFFIFSDFNSKRNMGSPVLMRPFEPSILPHPPPLSLSSSLSSSPSLQCQYMLEWHSMNTYHVITSQYILRYQFGKPWFGCFMHNSALIDLVSNGYDLPGVIIRG